MSFSYTFHFDDVIISGYASVFECLASNMLGEKQFRVSFSLVAVIGRSINRMGCIPTGDIQAEVSCLLAIELWLLFLLHVYFGEDLSHASIKRMKYGNEQLCILNQSDSTNCLQAL